MLRKALAAFLAASFFLVSTFLYLPRSVAHCPQTPFDDDVFAPIRDGGITLSLELAASGLTSPLKGVAVPGQPDRLYVVDQVGILWAVDLTASPPNNKTVFLDLRKRLVELGFLGPNTFDERGFLGVAFHPNYAQNGLLYTYTSEPNAGPPTFSTTLPRGTRPDHQNVVAEWRVPDPSNPASVVDPKSRRELMRVDWPQFNHDGGDLAFGPDGFLYISMGDGGGADDQDGQLFITPAVTFEPMVGHQGDGNAQKLNTPHGKVLRIDVDRDGNNPLSANGQYEIPADNPFVTTPGAVQEIFALGFRNPYRFSFDTATGALILGNVGQNDIEEIDVVVKGGNYGWNRKEGTLFFDPGDFALDSGDATTVPPGPVPAGLIDPVAQYDTHAEGHSVIGGFLYRGSRFPQLQGRYVFGEFARIFNFPSGPHNFGRLLYLEQKRPGDPLAEVQEFKGFAEAIAALGLSIGTAACEGLFPPTLAVLGIGQDASGELYVGGNISGLPFGTEGVVLRIAPK